MAEFYLQRPIFPGKNELDQLNTLCNILGTPTFDMWEDAQQLTQNNRKKIKWPKCKGKRLATLMPKASSEAIDLMEWMLMWDPKKRPTAK